LRPCVDNGKKDKDKISSAGLLPPLFDILKKGKSRKNRKGEGREENEKFGRHTYSGTKQFGVCNTKCSF
jgi:hypothetical protein